MDAIFNIIVWIFSGIAHMWGHHKDNQEIENESK